MVFDNLRMPKNSYDMACSINYFVDLLGLIRFYCIQLFQERLSYQSVNVESCYGNGGSRLLD